MACHTDLAASSVPTQTLRVALADIHAEFSVTLVPNSQDPLETISRDSTGASLARRRAW